jgi:far upstream element-binding protein
LEGPANAVYNAEPSVTAFLKQAETATAPYKPMDASANANGSASAPPGGDKNRLLAEAIAAQAENALAAAIQAPAAAYRPAPVAHLIGVGPGVASTSAYGPSSGEMMEEQIGVPNGVVGYIIGKGGESISSMQARSGCRVQIQKEHEMQPGSTTRVITLTGSTQESIIMCRGIIEQMVEERTRLNNSSRPMAMASGGGGAASQAVQLQQAVSEGQQLVTVQVPDADVGLIIGKMGSSIRSIQERSGANVQIPQAADPDNPMIRTVSVTHPTMEGANFAKQLIEEILASKLSRNTGGPASYGQSSSGDASVQVQVSKMSCLAHILFICHTVKSSHAYDA